MIKSLFSDVGLCKEREKEYIDFLRGEGYIVIPPSLPETSFVKTPNELVDLFYSLLQYYNRDRKIHYSKASKKDLSLAKQLIQNRLDSAGNKKIALQESVAIVKCVIQNEELFMFSEPIHSFACFGHDTMKWVIDKAISIINRENIQAEEAKLSLFMEELEQEQEKESLNSLGKRIRELKKVLGDLHGKER